MQAEEERASEVVGEGEAALEAFDETCPAVLHIMNNPLFKTVPWTSNLASTACTARDRSCPICLAEFELEQQVTTILRCNHSFHLTCLKRWMEAPPFSCP